MLEIAIQRLQSRLVAQMRRQLLAHGDQRAGTAGCHVHSPQQLLSRRIGGLRQPRCALGRGAGKIGLRGRPQRGGVGQEVGGEMAVETTTIVGIEAAQDVVQLARDHRAGGFAAFGQQGCREPLRLIERRDCIGR